MFGKKKKIVKEQRPFIYTEVVGKTDTTRLDGKQYAAEEYVSNVICETGRIHKLYNNIYLWNEDKSKIYQVDHIAIGSNFIYIIETKDVYGVPHYGARADEYWGIAPDIESRIYNYDYEGRSHWIKNPYKQNKLHIDFVRELCGDSYPERKFVNMIVFHAKQSLHAPTYTTEEIVTVHNENTQYLLTKDVKEIISDYEKNTEFFSEADIEYFKSIFDKYTTPTKDIIDTHLKRARDAQSIV